MVEGMPEEMNTDQASGSEAQRSRAISEWEGVVVCQGGEPFTKCERASQIQH